MLLTPERIEQAIKELHKRNSGKILHRMEVYQAIAQAQYNEDVKGEKNGRNENTGKGTETSGR